MARYQRGVLGPFNGKVGTVVGSTWKGIDVMRSLPRSSKRNSPKQLIQQAKFALVNSFLSSIDDFIKVMYRVSSDSMTSRNDALSHILKFAISGTYPDFAIAFDQVRVAKGGLPTPAGAHASVQNGKIRFEWADNSGTGKATASDKAVLLLYSVDLNSGVSTLAGPRRDVMVADFWDPTMNGHSVQAYLAFISADGSQVSPSVFLGQFLIN